MSTAQIGVTITILKNNHAYIATETDTETDTDTHCVYVLYI